jgi:hypothetical protein
MQTHTDVRILAEEVTGLGVCTTRHVAMSIPERNVTAAAEETRSLHF